MPAGNPYQNVLTPVEYVTTFVGGAITCTYYYITRNYILLLYTIYGISYFMERCIRYTYYMLTGYSLIVVYTLAHTPLTYRIQLGSNE